MKKLEFSSEAKEFTEQVDLANEINEFEQKLTEAQKDGDKEAISFYTDKVNELKAELSESFPESKNKTKKGDSLGADSDHYRWKYERSVANGNKIAARNAENDYARAKAKENLK